MLCNSIFKMNIKDRPSFRGPARAQAIGLHSKRFLFDSMGDNAREAIESIKKKDRPELRLEDWAKRQYYKSDLTKQLFDCPDEIERRNAWQLSSIQFLQEFQKRNKPVIIRGCTEKWNKDTLSINGLYKLFKNEKFKVGQDDDGCKLRMQMKYFMQYLIYNKDDSPLYLFEHLAQENDKAQRISKLYSVPPYFTDDLFKCIGEKRRPPYRWVLMGPQRSGSTVHIDPLLTSAWNTSLAGHKRWVLFGEHVPKGIVKGKQFRSKDYQDEAINYFGEVLPRIRKQYSKKELQIMEFIQYPGETVFVPGGWWHAVINLDDTLAVTQNVMTHSTFDKIWRSVRKERRKLALLFLAKLKEQDPRLFERANELNTLDGFEMGSKYEKQSVSLSFTDSSSSSSSSSSFSSKEVEEMDRGRKRSRSLTRSKNHITQKAYSFDKLSKH